MKKLCLISANCHGTPIQQLLSIHPEFQKNWNIIYYKNYEKQEIPQEELSSCDLLLHQGLGDTWEMHSASYLLNAIPHHTKSLILPNMMHFHLWPTAKANSHPDILWRDTYLDEVIGEKKQVPFILKTILETDFSKQFPLKEISNASLRREFQKSYFQKDMLFNFVQKNWQQKFIFTTPHHPAGELLALIANTIFTFLDMVNLSFDQYPFYCDMNFLPVHPFFIKHYNITYLNNNTKYPYFGHALTYHEYLLAYINATIHQLPVSHYLYAIEKRPDMFS